MLTKQQKVLVHGICIGCLDSNDINGPGIGSLGLQRHPRTPRSQGYKLIVDCSTAVIIRIQPEHGMALCPLRTF